MALADETNWIEEKQWTYEDYCALPDDGKRYELFGSGGGQELADGIGVALLGRIPLVPALREGGDVGNPVVAADPTSEAAQAFAAIAERVDVELAPTRRFHKELKIG